MTEFTWNGSFPSSPSTGDTLLMNDMTYTRTSLGTWEVTGGVAITETGALNSGSITSGFGTINNGASSITTTGALGAGATTVTTFTSTGIDDNATAEVLQLSDTEVLIRKPLELLQGQANIFTDGSMVISAEDNGGAGSMQFKVNALNSLTLNNDNSATFAGSVETTGVTVNQASFPAINFEKGGVREADIFVGNTNTLQIRTNDTNALILDASQNATFTGDVAISGAGQSNVGGAGSEYSSGSKLHVKAESSGDIRNVTLSRTGQSAEYSTLINADKLYLQSKTGGTETNIFDISATGAATFAGDVTSSHAGNASFITQRTGGAGAKIASQSARVQIGTTTAHETQLIVNNTGALTIDTSLNATFAGTITGNGSGLTALNGSNISSGTIAAARVATLNQNTTGSSGSCTGNAATVTNGVYTTGTQTIGGAKTFSGNITQTKSEAQIIQNSTSYVSNFMTAATANWAYTRMQSGTTFYDVAVNTGDASGAFQIRPAGSATNAFLISTAGDVTVNGSITNNAGSYTTPTTSNTMSTPYGNIQLGPMNGTYGHIYTDRASFYFNKTALFASGSTIWHAGNDGAGSTLDADLLDGVQGADYARKSGVDNLIINNATPTVYFQDTNHNSAMLHCNSGLFYILRGGNNSTTWATTNGHWPFHIDLTNNNANFGGSVTAVGNITAYSDRKLKDNLEVIPNALAKVSALTGYTYDRIDVDGVRQSGLIAQDVQKVLPEVVSTDVHSETKEETLTVAYGNMVGLLVESIKELNAKVDDLQKQLESK